MFEPCVQRPLLNLLLAFLVRCVALVSVVLLFIVPQAVADNDLSANPQDRLFREISQSGYWKKLVHYKSNLLSAGYRSDITDPVFFMSKHGREDPYRELVATVETFKNEPATVCRFPARYYWLSSRYGRELGLPENRLDSCTELQEWNKTINPGSATLVFPAAYLNGPSSMFGHTLLRIEPADERADLPLLTYAINYAANVSDRDNDVAFAFKGILGGYPGVMAIVPYHQKIKEYGEIENRDIWEYQLSLDKSEISQMLRHAWELKDLRSAYYFFDINCSYLILNLIETAREDINLTDQFRFKVIPVDTVRVVVDAGLVSDTQYRIAAATLLAQRYEYIHPAQRQQVKQILDHQPELSEVQTMNPDPADFARLVEIVYDTYRYRAFQTPSERDANAQYNLQLLNARSQLDVKNIWPEIVIPEFKPEQGHKSARLAVGYGKNVIRQDSQDMFFLKIRPAYHDLLDPDQGFPFGAQINFLDFSFSYNREAQKADIDSVTFIDILSLTPAHDLFDPISWRVDFSYEKRGVYRQDLNVLQVSPGFGKSAYLLNDFLGYGMLNGTLEYSPDYGDDYALGVGLQAGLLVTQQLYSAKLEVNSSRFFAGQTDTGFSANLGIARHLNANLSLRLTAEREKRYEHYVNAYQVNLNWYF